MKHSLCSLNTCITKNYNNLSNIFSSVVFKNMKNIVTFVGELVVDIHWDGQLVNDCQALMIYSLLFYPRSVGQYQGQRHYTSSRMLTKRMRIQDWETFRNFLACFVNFDCIICIYMYFNCSQHTMLIQFVIYFLKYSRPPPPPSLRFEIPGLPLQRSVFIHNLRLTYLTTDVS